jgi:hypothetical protein
MKIHTAGSPTSTKLNAFIKPTANMIPKRSLQEPSSFPSRPDLSNSRSTTHSKYSYSSRTGTQGQSRQELYRPKSSAAQSRQPPRSGISRPASSVGMQSDPKTGFNPNGMSALVPSFLAHSTRTSETGPESDNYSASRQPTFDGFLNLVHRSSARRESSLCAALGSLTLSSGFRDLLPQDSSPNKLPRPCTPMTTLQYLQATNRALSQRKDPRRGKANNF